MREQAFWGYRRANGRVGIRNHVVVLPVDDISNAACEAVAANIKGVLALPHAYGRLQFGEDLELFFRTLIGTGSNPNVAACVVIGIEPEWTRRIVDGISATGKPTVGLSVEGVAEKRGVDVWQAFFDLVQEGRVSTCPKSMNEEQKHLAMRAPFVCFDNDASPVNPQAVAIMMTAYRQEVAALVEEALRNHAYTCFYKPLEIEELLRLVEEIQERKRDVKRET